MSSRTIVLLLLTRNVLWIVAEDLKSAEFPFTGNNSVSSTPHGRTEFVSRPDATSLPSHANVPVNHFLTVPQRMLVHHRSDSLPYVYEHPHYGYPVAHSIDYPVGASSKHLVIVSFIGLLLLFAIVQNTLATVKRREMLTDVLAARNKRELYAVHDFGSVTPEQEDVLNEDARVRCIQRTVCLENRKLARVFGATGKTLAKYLTRGLEKSLRSPAGWERLVRDAGDAGIREEDCEVLYRGCDGKVSSKSRPVLQSPTEIARDPVHDR